MSSAIKHVIVLMLENRSFDHLLAYSNIPNLIGVDTSKANPDAEGKPVAMSNDTPDRIESDPGHEFPDVDWQIFGSPPGPALRPPMMNGFASKGWPEAMACAKPALVPVLTHLAREFLVCDQWFSSMPGRTWPNRFFVHAGSAGGLANSPSSLVDIESQVWSELGFSFQYGTLFDALSAAGRTWRVYHGDLFPQVCAIDTMPSVFVASPDVFRRTQVFATDMLRGDVADYTFIEPDYNILSSFRNGDSQHPCGTLSAGEQLISTVANAVISSPAWQSSMLIILYDEHGGFYDQMPPPAGVTPPNDDARNAGKAADPPDRPFKFDRLGVRIPAVVVSPWVTAGVSHLVYDHTSVIRTVFRVFGLPGQLTARDGQAASLDTLVESSMRTRTPAPLPPPNEPPPDPFALTTPRYVRTLDAFARIAAQIHHSLRTYKAGMRPQDLRAAINPTDDFSTLPGLPKTRDPAEARAYIEEVAALVASHRRQQRAGRTP